jgi:hypothetical protein
MIKDVFEGIDREVLSLYLLGETEEKQLKTSDRIAGFQVKIRSEQPPTNTRIVCNKIYRLEYNAV